MRQRSQSRFIFRADDPCLDFLNTEIFSRASGHREDLLNDFADLLDWLVEAGLLADRDANAVHTPAAHEAARVLSRATRLRASLRRTAERLAGGGCAHASALQELNHVLRESPPVEQLEMVKGRVEKRQIVRIEGASDVLQPIAQAAADLLASPRAALIRRCEGPECILFFLDTTKNHTRRWCSMQGCGNRVKVAEHRRRLAK